MTRAFLLPISFWRSTLSVGLFSISVLGGSLGLVLGRDGWHFSPRTRSPAGVVWKERGKELRVMTLEVRWAN